MSKDLIDRTELIRFLEAVTVTEGITFETGFKQILTDIRNQPREMQWIPVSEKLPENIKTVLVTIKESERPMLGWYGNKFGWRIVAEEFAAIKDYTVIAWMPLPEPYKEGEYENRK